ncbi:hypothetical protein EDC96DRAFT_517317 [Choanephora cucurbitarum]|uniref:CsbD-like domain-containing protein n=1 Tax=Choanephora cucurbitarum TaxID=101091 RepID=A0A1C7NIY2_9FUNG|nr:hypothetical protein EDC96DRAFT_517317 [Choanephora cucurbitarum]OBZ88948.1 hypothetical protein A0J61_03000 [Choanephora cucurbitarum]
MDSPSRTDAKKDQFVGDVKQNVGSAVGNESLESKGQAQNAAGHGQETAATLTDYVKGTADQVAGAVKGAYNSLTGNTTSEAGNKVQEKKGEAQKNLA